jgi:hypothetical protein
MRGLLPFATRGWVGNHAALRGEPFASSYALALDFAGSRYRNASDYKTDITQLSGYSYTRSGAKSELSASGSPIAFAANVPGIVPSVGYWSRQAFTNLLLRSQEFDNAAWVKQAGTTVSANAATAPDGTLTAGRVVALNAAAGDRVNQVATLSPTTVTASIWVKGEGANIGKDVQLTAKRASGGTFAGSSVVVTLTADWQRVSTSYLMAADNTAASLYLTSPATNSATDVLVWGAQLVAASVPGPYIATTSAAATVAEDNLPITLPSALTDQDMLIFAKGKVKEQVADQYLVDLTDGTASNVIQLRLVSAGQSKPRAQVTAAGVSAYLVTAVATAVGDELTVVLRRLGSNWRLGLYSSSVLAWTGTDTAGAFPANITTANIGNKLTGSFPARGPISKAGIINGTFDTDAKVIAAIGGI